MRTHLSPGTLWRRADAALSYAEQHPVRATALVAWSGSLLSAFVLHPGQLWQTQDSAQVRPSIFGQRWSFYTRDPETTRLLIAGVRRGQGADRDERERTSELLALADKLPDAPNELELTLPSTQGMLLCGEHLVAYKVKLSTTETPRETWHQPVHVTC